MLGEPERSPVIERDERGRNIGFGVVAVLAAGALGYSWLDPNSTFKSSAQPTQIVADKVAAAKPGVHSPVMDEAGVLSDQVEAELAAKIALLKAELGPELVVLTVSSLNGQSVESYALARANHMRIGDRERNDGILLVIAPTDHEVRLEVGSGLTTALSNQTSASLIQEMQPSLRLGQYGSAANVAVDGLTANLRKLKSFLPRKAA